MLEMLISALALVCSGCVAGMSLHRWQRTSGYSSAIYLAVCAFAGTVAVLNLSALFADPSFVRTAALAYVGFATSMLLPVGRALSNLTYETPGQEEREDPAV